MKPCGRCCKKQGHALLRWGALLALGVALEAEAVAGKRHPHTLSHAIRRAFKIGTPHGRGAFIGFWAALTCWLIPHILKGDPK